MGKNGKGKKSGKEERRERKANANRDRERGRRRGAALDRAQLATFAGALRAAGYTLLEVERDGTEPSALSSFPTAHGQSCAPVSHRKKPASLVCQATASSARSPTS